MSNFSAPIFDVVIPEVQIKGITCLQYKISPDFETENEAMVFADNCGIDGIAIRKQVFNGWDFV